jgi:hypothetical protein
MSGAAAAPLDTAVPGTDARAAFADLRARMGQAIIGQERVIECLLIALLADGNALVEGLPGVAKTRAVKALAKNLDARFRRIQFTPNLLPSDVVGSEIYEAKTGEFRFEAGPSSATWSWWTRSTAPRPRSSPRCWRRSDPLVLQDHTDRGVLRALRLESATFVPQRLGPVELPGFAIAWFDPRGGQLRAVRVDPVRVVALPAGGAPAEAATPSRRASPWLVTAAALLLGAGGALADPARDAFAALAAACRAEEARTAMAALFRWCDAVLPQDGGQGGIARLAALTRSPELAAEARRLKAHLYGAHPPHGGWGGAAAASPRVVLRNWAR